MKKILYVIGSLVVIVGVLSLLAPNDFKVERTVSINAPASLVYSNISFFEKHQNWSPWNEKDPDLKYWIDGEDGKVGAIYNWEGDENVGVGEQELTALKENESVEMKIRFMTPYEVENDAWFNIVKGEESSLNVSWGIAGSMGFPMDIMMMVGIMDMDAQVGPDFEKGLINLKSICESEADQSATSNFPIELVKWEPHYMIAVRDTVNIAENGAFMMENFPKLYENLGKAGINPMGPSCGLYFMWDEENNQTDMCVAAQVSEGDAAPAGTSLIELGESQAAVLTYTGPYSGLGNAHMSLANYMESSALEFKGPAVEEYLVDMSSEAESTKWVTKIYYFY